MRWLTILVLLAVPALAQDKPASIDRLVDRYRELEAFNGSVLVADGGEVVLQKGYGFANFEWEIPNAPDTKFRIGSITKQFTSMVVMQLVQEGKVRLDASVLTYLKEYRKDTGEKVTIHHLLNHTSGIPSYTGNPEFRRDGMRDPYTPDAFVAEWCSGDLEFEPGTQFRYNNSAYFMLGAIIEKVTGKSYEEALRTRIFLPLGMKDSGYDRHAPLLAKRAAGYQRSLDELVNAPYLDMSIPYSAGSLYSTVEDLYKWHQALLTEKLLPESAKKKMWTPGLRNYAYGWAVRDGMQQHGGGIFGFNTLLVRWPGKGRLIVLLNNTSQAPLRDMMMKIVAVLDGRPAGEPRLPPAREIMRILLRDGADAAVEYWNKHPQRGRFDAGAVLNAGTEMLRRGRVKEAIEFLRFLVAVRPDAAQAHNRLGEAYLAAGQRAKAIESYREALKRDPAHEDARDALKRLGEKDNDK